MKKLIFAAMFVIVCYSLFWQIFRSKYYDFYKSDTLIYRTEKRLIHFSENAKAVIWILGGSTAWSAGVPENETIGYHLSQSGYTVETHAIPGYVSKQQLLQLVLLLRDKKPDAVVFLDGFNDVHAGYQNGVADEVKGLQRRQDELNLTFKTIFHFLYFRLFRSHAPAEDFSIIPKIIASYKDNIKMADEICRDRGIKFVHIVQPFLSRRLLDIPNSKNKIRKYFEEAHMRLSPVNMPEEYFTDWCHLSGNGNMLLARRIEYELEK